MSAGLRPAQLILVGDGTQHGQTLHLAPALLHQMEHINAHRLDLATLHRQSARSPEEACVQVFHEARRNLPSIIYVPNIDEMWMLVSETVKAIFLSQLTHLDPNVPILILATANTVFSNLPLQVRVLNSQLSKCQLHFLCENF